MGFRLIIAKVTGVYLPGYLHPLRRICISIYLCYINIYTAYIAVSALAVL